MTDIRRTATALTLAAAVVTGLGAPAAVAQTTAPATEAATTAPASESPAPQEEEKDDNGNWGLWGLAGLLGLAGLIAAPVASQPAGTYGLVGGAILSAVLSIFESWRVWRADPDRQPF